jgi:hypothetical protein
MRIASLESYLGHWSIAKGFGLPSPGPGVPVCLLCVALCSTASVIRHSFRLYLPWGGNTIIERMVPDQAGCGDTRGQVIYSTCPIIESVINSV